MSPSSNRPSCVRHALPRWDEGSGVHTLRARQNEWPLPRSEIHTLDPQGGLFRALSLGQLGLSLASAPRCGSIRPTRSGDWSEGPIPSSRRGRRVGLLQARLCFLVSRLTGVGALPLRACAL